MVVNFRLKLAIAIAALAAAPHLDAAPNPIVRIESGRVQGVIQDGSPTLKIFRGIPFAAPPVGNLRWREPQPVKPWRGVRQATQFGPRWCSSRCSPT